MRRTWLACPLAALAQNVPETFQKQNVLGTSLELQVRGAGGEEAFAASLAKVEGLRRILSTYDRESYISRWIASGESAPIPAELRELLELYENWQNRSRGAISSKLAGRRDVNALGKSLILRRRSMLRLWRLPKRGVCY